MQMTGVKMSIYWCQVIAW